MSIEDDMAEAKANVWNAIVEYQKLFDSLEDCLVHYTSRHSSATPDTIEELRAVWEMTHA